MMRKTGKVTDVCVSSKKGVSKTPVGAIRLLEDVGVEGDAHAGTPARQVSLLCEESAQELSGSGIDLSAGVFAENLRVEGLAPGDFRLGTLVRLQRGALLEVSQMGKECHKGCAIARQVGRCVMPTEGVFARVVRGGEVRAGDSLEVTADEDTSCRTGDQ